jgi:EAL domain-containing protein (putative c-di-GMP-specific phosphodiesterase class I)/GGDEF domain-containing protein
MSLRSRLILLLLFTSLFGAGVYSWVQLVQTQQYLKQQLNIHAQDTAHYFGMWSQEFIASGDLVMVETQANSLVDSNYIAELVLKDPHGNIIIHRHSSNQIEGVPSWFINSFTLESGAGHSELFAWNKLGEIEITANTGLAYEYLWLSAKKNLAAAIAIATLAAMLGMWLLFWILKPLRAIEEQANAIAEHDYVTIETLPQASELRSVVNAMNHMAKAIARNFKALSDRADKLQASNFIDELTQLGNRKAFIDQLQAQLKDNEQPLGSLWFVRLIGLESLQQRAGAPVAKDQIKRASALCKMFAEQRQGLAYRTSESEIAMLIQQTHQLQEAAETLTEALTAQAHPEQTQGIAIIGICQYHPEMEIKQLLANGDHALTLAGQPSKRKYHILAPEEALAPDRLDINLRRKKLMTLITPPRLKLCCQPIFSGDQKQILMYELLSRFYDEQGQPLNTPDIFAELNRFGLVERLDREVIMEALRLLQTHKQACFSINLSMQSLLDKEFSAWLVATAESHLEQCERLTFELSEYLLQQYMDAAQLFIKQLRELGIKITVEKFGVSTLPFAYLREIRPDHIKIAGNYVHNLQADQESYDFLHSLIQLGHGLDIKVFAEQVEQTSEAAQLNTLHIDGLQGYLFGRPEAVHAGLFKQ